MSVLELTDFDIVEGAVIEIVNGTSCFAVNSFFSIQIHMMETVNGTRCFVVNSFFPIQFPMMLQKY